MRWVLAGVLGACSFQHGVAPSADAPGADAARPVDAPLPPLGPWGAPTVVTLPPPTTTDDDPSPTDDLLELYINTARNGNADVYVSTRASLAAAWSSPVIVPSVSSTANETTPEVSYDGLTIIVASDRVGTTGGNDLWMSTRASRTVTWGNAMRIAALSSTDNEAAGNMTPDGLAIVFSSNRTGNAAPDLFIAERATPSDDWSAPVEIAAVNTLGHEGSPFLSADKLTLYFDTDRGGSLDIYVSQRSSTTEPFPAPTPLVEINTADADQDPWVSRDGRRLWLSSNRGGTNQLWEATR
jgi:Tol biopolymer transport system component